MLLKALAVVLLFSWILGCDLDDGTQTSENTKPLSQKQLEQFQSCEQDSECAYAQNGCCDCANGGQAVAINKSKLKEFKASFTCKNVSCTEKAPISPCDSGQAKCQNKRCTFTLKRNEGPIQRESIVMVAPWTELGFGVEPDPLPQGWEKHVANQDIVTDYAGGKVNIQKDQTYFTYNGKIAVGWHGSFSPPTGM